MKIPFLLMCLLFCSCVGQGAKLADGTWLVNHGAFSHKSESEEDTMDATLPNGVHIVMHHGAVKPDGTEWTKVYAFDALKTLGKYTAHSTDLKTKYDGIAKVKGTVNPNIIPKDPNVIPVDPNIIQP